MQDDETKSGNKVNPLKSLEKDLRYYEESIKDISIEILKSELSKYPVFLAHQHEIELGELILDKNELGTDWSIHATTMEELIEKNLILKERKEFFELNYKDPKGFICLLVIVPEGANFVFYPYH